MKRCCLLAVVLLAVAGCQTSCTPPPNCPDGTHVERAPSYSGHVWQCVSDGGAK